MTPMPPNNNERTGHMTIDAHSPLHYQAYLLAYDLGKLDLYDRTRTAFLVRAAVLVELALQGSLSDRDGDAVRTGSGAAGDPVLDQALDAVGERTRSWKSWLRHDYKRTLEAVEDRLADAGQLTIVKRRLLLVPKTRIRLADPAAAKALQDHLCDVLQGTEPTANIAPRDAALLVLARAGSVPSVTARINIHAFEERIDDLVNTVEQAAPGLGTMLRGTRTTMIAAQGGMGGSG